VTSKRTVILLSALAGLLLVIASFRPWITGTSTDVVLGGTPLTALGSQAVPGLLSLGLLVVAAAVALVTAGRLGRAIGLLAYAAALALVLGLTLRALTSPHAILGPIAGTAAGRAGSLPVTTAMSIWPRVALAGALLGALAWGAALLGSRTWTGLGARYEQRGNDVAGSRGERVDRAWDELSAGRDPTLDDDRPLT
jgi:uncharacterized membrane protein (TIGR02234 family)